MGKVRNWFKRNKIDINIHVNNKFLECTPYLIWWIHIIFVTKFSRVTTITFKRLQGHHDTATMQRTHLVSMQTYMLHQSPNDKISYVPLDPVSDYVHMEDLNTRLYVC